MNSGGKDTDRLREQYDDFYTTSEFAYYPRAVSMAAVRSIMRICRLKSGARVLDVGCGTGYYSGLFHEAGCTVTGIDISARAIAIAEQRFPQVGFIAGDALSFETNERFDCIFSLGMSVMNTRDIENVRDYIRRMVSLLAPGGVIAFLGDSDLSGGHSRTDSWVYHSWADILAMQPDGTCSVEGPYLTHFRLMALFPRVALTRPLTTVLRLLPVRFPRKFLYLFRPA